jgi:hypothetical protein
MRRSAKLARQDGATVGQVPDLPSLAPTAPWQVGDLPHGGSCSFHIWKYPGAFGPLHPGSDEAE